MSLEKKQVNPEVVIPRSQRHGVFANAFRVLPDGAEFLLDFLIYSSQEQSAKVVSRVRVTPAVLAAIKERLGESQKVPNHVVLAQGSEEVH